MLERYLLSSRVRLSVRPSFTSQSSTKTAKRIGSHKQRQERQFSEAKDLGEIPKLGHPQCTERNRANVPTERTAVNYTYRKRHVRCHSNPADRCRRRYDRRR